MTALDASKGSITSYSQGFRLILASGEGAAAALEAMVGEDGAAALERAVEAAAAGDLGAVVDPLLEALSAIRALQVTSSALSSHS